MQNSVTVRETAGRQVFSPRTWGCPPVGVLRRRRRGVLPTHVGVPPRTSRHRVAPVRSPHARGGVPWTIEVNTGITESSLHAWGCPRLVALVDHHHDVLPTRVGVARGSCSAAVRRSPSSPRVWGCPHRRAAEVQRPVVLPTRVGVSRTQRRRPGRRRGPPHAHGGVPWPS